MYRAMRRKDQALSYDACVAILNTASSGVLAIAGDDDYPYAVPLSYAYHDDKIFFHCALTGHKLDALARNPRVCFCVIGADDVVPEEYATYYQSVIAFGTARVLEDAAEMRAALVFIAKKYAPDDDEQGRAKEIDSTIDRVCVVELAIEHMTGKEAAGLVRARRLRDASPDAP